MAIPQQLTPDQQDVVNARARTTLVIAPAGSGKTEVLIRRIERLLDESPAESFRLLAVTFTVKAADELKSRLSRSVGEEAWRVDANTIHGFALDWLQRSGQPVGISSDVVVYAQSRDCVDLLRRFLDSVEESHFEDRTLLDILEQINNLRTRLVKPSEAPNQSFIGSVVSSSRTLRSISDRPRQRGGDRFSRYACETPRTLRGRPSGSQENPTDLPPDSG